MSKVFHFSKYIYKSNSFCFPFLSLPCVTKCGLRIELLKSSRKARFSKEKKTLLYTISTCFRMEYKIYTTSHEYRNIPIKCTINY